ncbi:TonB family protein [Lysobacter sp. cf310]|uniref:TonB family protein n=1 Tax=Lysobacter sp. cf310 TaxID=1761790 RepID=UPI0008F25D91|nr:TonB family protein [Lysobacter sp. cf310]SFK40483.1 TonB family C-terminal domain-containing protein [Lysobacter sp. cf310]
MSSVDIAAVLWETALASSFAIAVVLLLRRPLRRGFGAAAAYALWALVPAAVVAVLLPAAPARMPLALPVQAMVQAPLTVAAPQAPGIAPADTALAIWLAGALLALAALAWQQRRFVRALGVLRPRADGLRQADAVAGLPAAIGLLRPIIVVPEDFERRYSVEQQALMRAHEREHIARGDLALNAAVAALRCVYWFNPLLHYAVRHYRHDQELSCDQRVIRRHPQARRAYGEAMLKTQLASRPVPLGCHWGHSHPLKERIEMLKHANVSSKRWISGGALVALLAAATGAAAWSAQPQRAPAAAAALPDGYALLKFEVSLDGGDPSSFRVLERYGESFGVSGEEGGSTWSLQGRVSPLGEGQSLLVASLQRDGKPVGQPRLTVRNGQPARISIGSVRGSSNAEVLQGIDMTVTVSAAADARPVVQPRPMAEPRPAAKPAPTPVANPRAQTIELTAAAYGALSPPPYPKGRKVNGRVLLEIQVGSDGGAQQVRLAQSSGDAELDASTVEAARKWRFQPATQDGRPVASWVQVPVDFAATSGPTAAAPFDAATVALDPIQVTDE